MLRQRLFRRSVVCARQLATEAPHNWGDDSDIIHNDALEYDAGGMRGNIFHMLKNKKKCTPIPVRERVADVRTLLPGLRVGTPFFEDMVQPDAHGNEELAKISNFLHLTPPMVEAHTSHLKELCTPCPDRPKRPVKIYKTNYAFVGPSMKQPMSRNVSIKVDINDLDIAAEHRDTFEQLVTAHPKDDFMSYHRVGKHPRRKAQEFPVLTKLEGGTLTITGQQCPTRDQNTNLCFYRLSGFLDEAPKLAPITKSLTITNNAVAFICGVTEGEVTSFFEERNTGVELGGEGSIQITGSEAAVSAVTEYLSEAIADLNEVQLDIPEQFTDYVQYESREMERILSEYDVFLAPDCSMIGYSDVTEQCSQEIAEYVAKLELVEMHLEPKYSFDLSNDKFKRDMDNLDCQASLTPSGHFTAVLEAGTNVEKLKEFIQIKIGDIEKRSKTATISCDFDIPDHIKEAIHVYVEYDGSKVTATGEPSRIEDLTTFIEKKKLRLKS